MARPPPIRAAIVALLAAIVLALPTPARATEKRERQDYGAPKEGTSPGEVIEWVPRVGLFPLWLVSEYGLRRPLGAFVKVAERDQWPLALVDFFTFGSRRQIAIYPSALLDFGLLPSVGLNLSWSHFVAEDNTIRAHFGFWGPDWIALKLADRYALSARSAVGAEARLVRRQDNPFYGIGPESRSGDRVRYQSTTLEATALYENRFWRSSVIEARAGVRSVGFDEGACCGNMSLRDAVAGGAFRAPPGFDRAYTAMFERLTLAVDSRRDRPESGSGFRFEGRAEGVFVPARDAVEGQRAWVRYGASAGAALDLTGKQRVLSLTLAADFADPLSGAVPFTELASLGGNAPMRGYLANRLLDRSSLVASLRYSWPIWPFLDGMLETEVGNVFGARLDGFDPGLLRLSSGIGVRSNGARDAGFELLVAGGTEPFRDGFSVSSFRLVLGSHHGF